MSRIAAACAAIAFATVAGHAAAADKPQDFERATPLVVSGTGPWYAIELPMSARLAARHADLRDVRVFNAEGEALPYGFRGGAAAVRETAMESRARIFPLPGAVDKGVPDTIRVVRDSAGTIVEIIPARPAREAREPVVSWLLDLGDAGFAARRLRLDWRSSVEGFQRLRIEASDDLKQWRYIGESQVARLSFNGERIERNEIDLPELRSAYLRVTWLDPEAGVTLEGAVVSGTRVGTQEAPLTWSDLLTGQADKENEFVWRLPYALPLERLRIPLPQNSLAPLVVEGRSGVEGRAGVDRRIGFDRRAERRAGSQEAWRVLARDVLYRLPLDGQDVRQEEVGLSGTQVSTLRLKIDPRGSGLQGKAPQLSFALRTTELIFLARGSQPYRLVVGNPGATDASLPLTTLVPGYSEAKRRTMGAATLAGPLRGVAAEPARATPPSAQSAPLARPTSHPDWKRWGLWGVLVLGVALLAGMATSLLRGQKDAK